MTEESPQKAGKKSVIASLIIFAVSVALVIPWQIFLESLKKDNPQLSTSFFVQLLPIWAGLFIAGIVKNKKK